MSPLIWCDADGVLFDFQSKFLAELNMLTGRNTKVEEWTTWLSYECVCTKEEEDQVWRIIDHTPGWVRNIPVYPWAPKLVEGLRKLGRLRCLTSPHYGPTWVPERARALQTSQLGFSKKEIVFASDKGDIQGDVLIDDKVANFLTSEGKTRAGLKLLLDQPWNSQDNHNPAIAQRVHLAATLPSVVAWWLDDMRRR